MRSLFTHQKKKKEKQSALLGILDENNPIDQQILFLIESHQLSVEVFPLKDQVKPHRKGKD